MSGELAECYRTKAEGVRHILETVLTAAAGRPVDVYCCNGQFCDVPAGLEQPLLVAAANWHALAAFSCRYVGNKAGLDAVDDLT